MMKKEETGCINEADTAKYAKVIVIVERNEQKVFCGGGADLNLSQVFEAA